MTLGLNSALGMEPPDDGLSAVMRNKILPGRLSASSAAVPLSGPSTVPNSSGEGIQGANIMAQSEPNYQDAIKAISANPATGMAGASSANTVDPGVIDPATGTPKGLTFNADSNQWNDASGNLWMPQQMDPDAPPTWTNQTEMAASGQYPNDATARAAQQLGIQDFNGFSGRANSGDLTPDDIAKIGRLSSVAPQISNGRVTNASDFFSGAVSKAQDTANASNKGSFLGIAMDPGIADALTLGSAYLGGGNALAGGGATAAAGGTAAAEGGASGVAAGAGGADAASISAADAAGGLMPEFGTPAAYNAGIGDAAAGAIGLPSATPPMPAAGSSTAAAAAGGATPPMSPAVLDPAAGAAAPAAQGGTAAAPAAAPLGSGITPPANAGATLGTGGGAAVPLGAGITPGAPSAGALAAQTGGGAALGSGISSAANAIPAAEGSLGALATPNVVSPAAMQALNYAPQAAASAAAMPGAAAPAAAGAAGTASTGATSATGGAADAGAAGAAPVAPKAPGAAPTGIPFVDNILGQLGNNAVALGLIGAATYGATRSQPQIPNQAQLSQLSADAQQVAHTLITQYQSGQLNAGQQAKLDQLMQGTRNQLNNYFASIGQSDSTAHALSLSQVDQSGLALQQQMLDDMLTQGLSAIGIAQGPLNSMAQYQLGQDQNLRNAFGQFASAVGQLFGRTSGQQTPQQPQSGVPAAAQPQIVGGAVSDVIPQGAPGA